MVDPPPGGIAQWSPDGSAMPLRGVLEGGSTINLVPSHTTHGTAQILSAVIGGLGAAFFGAGLGPYVSRSTPLPIEAVRAIADACATKGVHCEVLEIGQPHMGGWLIVGGLILIGVQVAVFFLTTPGRQRDPSPAAPPSPQGTPPSAAAQVAGKPP